jgi:ATP-dependent Clp protease ATP-binding subunit ClpA
VQNALAKQILEGTFKEGDTILVTMGNEELVFKKAKPAAEKGKEKKKTGVA